MFYSNTVIGDRDAGTPIKPIYFRCNFNGCIVLAAFSQRRKTLRNTLNQYLKADDFYALGIDSGLRAENLSMENFVAIANFLEKR